jgi:hypothetical protein
MDSCTPRQDSERETRPQQTRQTRPQQTRQTRPQQTGRETTTTTTTTHPQIIEHTLTHLIAKPITAFHSVVGVPAPVIFAHVTERGVDATLSGHRVRTRWEQFADAGGIEPLLGETEGRAQTTASRADHQRIVGVIHHRIVPSESGDLLHVGGGRGARRSAHMQRSTACQSRGASVFHATAHLIHQQP